MFPLRDDAPRFTIPYVTWTLIAVNVAVFMYQLLMNSVSPQAELAFIQTFGTVPARVTAVFTGSESLAAGLIPIVTSIFLHGGWMHLIGNMWFLWIFGDNVEDELGHGFYLFFYLCCGIFATTAHYLADIGSMIPLVGASGAIAGVMGAYMVRFPKAQVTVLLPIIVFWTVVRWPAYLMLLVWFGIQFFNGWANSDGGVAWWTHIGGFVVGIGLVMMRPRRRKWHHTWTRE